MHTRQYDLTNKWFVQHGAGTLLRGACGARGLALREAPDVGRMAELQAFDLPWLRHRLRTLRCLRIARPVSTQAASLVR